jgi:hypothetical protein
MDSLLNQPKITAAVVKIIQVIQFIIPDIPPALIRKCMSGDCIDKDRHIEAANTADNRSGVNIFFFKENIDFIFEYFVGANGAIIIKHVSLMDKLK